MYALVDIFREELDLPIPDCPHSGYIPRPESPRPIVSRPEKDVCEETCDPEYYADDEMSALHSPMNHDTDATDATGREERRGVSEQLDEDRSALSNFSYYYYHDSDYQPPSQIQKMNSFLLRSLLKIVEDIPLTQAESWVRCKGWRYQTAKATGVTKTAQGIASRASHTDADVRTSPPFSIFQILHDQPVDTVCKMKGVMDWQETLGYGSFGSIPSAPPSLISYLARRRSSLPSLPKVLSLDPDIDTAKAGFHPSSTAYQVLETKCLTVIEDADEPKSERQSAVVPCEQRYDLATAQATVDAPEQLALRPPACESQNNLAIVEDIDLYLVSALNAGGVSELPAHSYIPTVGLIGSDRGDEKVVIKQTHFTPQMVRSIIDILTAPSADIQRLRSFWEGQSGVEYVPRADDNGSSCSHYKA